jgi:hypothetical protein
MKEQDIWNMVEPFEPSEAQPVYLAKCCGRVFVGYLEPQKCRTCADPPNVMKIVSMGDLKNTVATL